MNKNVECDLLNPDSHLSPDILLHHLSLFLSTRKMKICAIFSTFLHRNTDLIGRESTWASLARAASGVMSEPGMAPALIKAWGKIEDVHRNKIVWWPVRFHRPPTRPHDCTVWHTGWWLPWWKKVKSFLNYWWTFETSWCPLRLYPPYPSC